MTHDGRISLAFVWRLRLQIRAEGDKLRAEGAKLWAESAKLRAEGAKLWAEGAKLWVEGDKLRAEGDKLRAEGDKLWAEGVLDARGDIWLSWKVRANSGGLACVLATGETFEP